MLKIALCLCSVLVAVHSGVPGAYGGGYSGGYSGAYGGGRGSGQYIPDPLNSQYAPIPFSFNYVAPATGGSSSRTESGDGSGRVTGSYTINDADGRSRVVNYVADAGGFRAQVETNEPGTLTSNAADAIYRSNAPAVVYGPPSSYLGAASVPGAYKYGGGAAGGAYRPGGFAGAGAGAGRGHHAW